MSTLQWARRLSAVIGSAGVAAALTTDGSLTWTVSAGGVAWGLHVDRVSAVLLTLVGLLGWLVTTYAVTNLRGQRRLGRFGLLAGGALAALGLMVTGASLPVVALGWTASGLAIAALVGHAGTPGARRAAAHTRRQLLVGDALLWLGVLVALLALPTVDRAELAALGADGLSAASGAGAATAVALCLVAAGLVRSALVPFHRWLPETAEAPSPVSALLHAGVVNGAGILPLLAWPVLAAAPAALLLLVVAGVASVALGTLAAQVRTDVKGRLACSTTAQMGWMAVQLGLGLPAAALLHLVGHGCYKAWLFLRAGGEVTRSRRRPAPQGAAVPRVRGDGLPWATLAALVAVLGAAPAAVHQVELLGAPAVLPFLLAVSAAAVAGRAAGRDRGPAGPRTGVAVLAGLGAAAYGWLLLGWESLLSDPFPPVPVWDGVLAVALVAGIVTAGALLLLGVRRVGPTSTSALAVRLGGSALPPWHARVGGRAGWPTARAAGDRRSGGGALGPEPVAALVRTAGTLVSPQWPLREMVAANPLANLETMPFDDAVQVVERVHGAAGNLPLGTYHWLHATGRISRGDLAVVVADLTGGTAGRTALDVDLSVEQFLEASAAEAAAGSAAPGASPAAGTAGKRAATLRFCEAAGDDRGTARLAGLVDDHAALWTQRAWSRAHDDAVGPWRLWRAAAVQTGYERQVRVRGLSRLVRDLPEDPAAALAVLLDRAGVSRQGLVGYVCRTLAAAPGWAAHAQWRVRRTGELTPLLELVALRVALDVLFTGAVAARPVDLEAQQRPQPERTLFAGRRLASVWQLAYERGVHDDLLARLQRQADGHRPEAEAPAARPSAQLVLCIDVRSERLRRALERQGDYETFGAAGFFGAAVRYHDADGGSFDQCPALVVPTHEAAAAQDGPVRLRSRVHRASTSLGSAPAVPLVLAEAGGLPAAAAALAATVLPSRWRSVDRSWTRRALGRQPAPSPRLHVAMTQEERADLAEGLLRAIGLVDGFAPLLVVCGHVAAMENNAYASAYDCGACGGNGGEVNAVVVVDALNDPEVRRRLAARGITLPADTVAVAAVHETTTDALTVDPLAQARLTHAAQLEALERDARLAAAATCEERLRTLPDQVRGRRRGPGRRGDARTVAARRASDWSEPTPEWGLAGNAAMLIGPRRLSADLDLDGRVFLHSYDERQDPDRAVLESLLNAPAVVGQWINAQYYFSTVAPDVLGAGDKTTHNVVGDVGVLTGAHGDLRLGLPWQALFAADPAEVPPPGAHEPVRQLVVVAAAPEAVLAVVRRSTVLQRLVCGEWLHLACLSPDDGADRRVHLVTTDLRTTPWSPPLASPWTDPSADPFADAVGPR
ncbi:putative inorganic carbon transporter subunit DabA [Nocardioides mesophilus]|uniref:Probable inorganic carbon transporter subunit DabA n=1 Tax=Nocardioides mesophilus TaxID=433659 RepID=A0A7G9RFK8_9ACTN|nr:putative inorganic carbon transporter subunit DabA [Nocardioides mesophilus]QNN54383.1 DUF2309 family protein [Nocardioides mesophilus]